MTYFTITLLSILISCDQDNKAEIIDEALDTSASDCMPSIFYLDNDSDGYGDVNALVEACEQPEGTVSDSSDCDDTDAAINPSGVEVCNNKDDDCNGLTDDGVGETWYADSDGDGFGNANSRQQACELEDGWVANDEDCNDGNALVNPDAEEICDETDNDCDGDIDEGVTSTWYADNDFDSYGDPNDTVESCTEVEGRVDVGGDCNDGTAAVYPGALDICNATDDDCDGIVDEDVKVGWSLVTIDTQSMKVYEINTNNASVTEIATIQPGLTGINSMDVWEDGTAIVHSNAGSVLHSFDVCQGTGFQLGATGVSAMGGISFGGGNQLYGLNPVNDQLMLLSLSGGPASVVGTLGDNIGNNGMAYDCSTDTIYGADAIQDRIFTVNPNTGLASNFVNTSVPFASVGLEFDHATGLLWASTGSQLWTIEPTTGASTLVGTFSGMMVDDLAFHPVCP